MWRRYEEFQVFSFKISGGAAQRDASPCQREREFMSELMMVVPWVVACVAGFGWVCESHMKRRWKELAEMSVDTSNAVFDECARMHAKNVELKAQLRKRRERRDDADWWKGEG